MKSPERVGPGLVVELWNDRTKPGMRCEFQPNCATEITLVFALHSNCLCVGIPKRGRVQRRGEWEIGSIVLTL